MASTSNQTVPSSFTSAFSKPQPEYDVFLSFRGVDTRYKFTDHIYNALSKEIIAFRDDKEVEMGETISLELSEAIEKTRMAVIIFSKNFASSTWCLEELAKIVECRDRGILTVLPIFYHVEPTDVRHQKNAFAEAFEIHEKRFEKNPEKVHKWRAALTNVAKLSGKLLEDRMYEADFIQSIVQWICLKLKRKCSNDIEDDLVGISSRVEEMILYLDLESTDVHFIEICDKSGMGKTTLARAVFDKILDKFDACSFLENVREESKAHGLKTLQERLLCDIGKGGLRVKDEHDGMQVIRDILHNKKVLIVVDDVSERSQLEKLVGKRDLFGKGSRIIVTTEDKDLLASYEIKIEYKVRGLNEVEALRVFSLNAFHKPHCENDFQEYCNNFVKYAQRNPLVLKVLGSYLCTRTKNEWESAQNQLRAIPLEKTTKKLRIAFDGLGAEEKKLFLDISSFFKGEEKNRVADILESDINLKNLIDKSLITLVRGGKLWMHNLLQQMGWEIVSEESEEDRKPSRLWHCDDVLDVLKNNTGTKHIEGMLLRLPPDEEEELHADSFSKMNKLRLLKICKVRLSCLSYLSNELRLLEWHDYPLESLPNSFQPGELVELIMHRSCLQQFPSEFSKLGKLKLIDLSDSQNLTRTPDFTGFSNIERLNFQGCTRLHELHPSVGGLKRLILLNLKDCKCLKNLPYELNLESLKTLILSGCSRLKKFPHLGRNMRSLLELYLDGTAIEELPPTIRRLTGLTLLNLQDCKNLKSFSSDIHSLTSLEILTLSGCKCQSPKAGHLLGFSPIGSSIGAALTFPQLISFLFLSFLAWQYTYLRMPIFAITALSTYCFHNAQHTEQEPINLLLSNSPSKLSTLVTLSLSDCNLFALPDDPSCLLSIEYLNLSKNNFICLPGCISQLPKLKILFLDHCSKLKSLPYVPLSTRLVSVQGCTALENYSNQVVVWTLGVAGFTIITGLGLAKDEDDTIAEVSLLEIHLLWQRYVKDQIHQMEGFCHVLPQIEIPEWFERPRSGSFRPISLPSNLFSNKNWKGIALCVIFVVPAHSNDISPGEDKKYFHEFYCRLDIINGDLIAFKVPKETHVDSFGLWLYISHARFRKHLDERSCITPLIGTNSPDVEIKMCGARILYKQDMGEFLQNLGQKIFGSPNDLRGELKSHSQLSRLYQVDQTRYHLSEYIFPQNASPPRSFAYQNGPAVKTQLPAVLHDYSRWRPTPVTKLLPSNGTIQGECTSRETIFSNQVIATGTSESSRQGSVSLGKISSSLECWCNHVRYLQDHYEGPGTHSQCLPQSEIPGWFKSENIASSSSVTIQLPLKLYDNFEWIGFAFFAVFSFQKHPTVVPMKGSEFSFNIVCHLKTNLGCMNPLYSISEKDVIISLRQRGFLWLSFIPSWFLSHEWRGCTSVEFSFVSDSSVVSALQCGVDLVYRQKLEFTRRMVQCITSYDGPFTSFEGFPFYHPDQFSGGNGSSGTSGHYSYDQFCKTAALGRYNNRSIFNQCIPQSEMSEWFSHDSLPSDLSPKFDFHPSTSYNFCFPPSKIQDWFSHPNHGHSVTIDLPSNLYHDSNWMGLVLYASFSIHGDPNIIFSNLASGKSHFLYCQCQTSMANVDDQTIAFSTNKEEITWLLNLGEFIWICYVPGEPFKNMLPHCSHIEASFVSDWSGVTVQNCALQLLYQHDQVQFTQELKHCNNLISENRKLVCKQQEDQQKKKDQYHVDEGLQRKIFSNIDFEAKIFPRLIDQPETDETEIQLGQSDLLENQEKVDKRRVASKELTKIPGEHLEKGYSSGLELANFVVTLDILHDAWTAIWSLYTEVSQNEGPSSFVRFKVYELPNYTIIAFFTWPSSSKDSVQGVGGGNLVLSSTFKGSFPCFDFLSPKTKDPSFSINEPAFQLFKSIFGVLPKFEIDNSKPLIITGNSLGGSVATLFTLSLFENFKISTTKRPLCITFGSPLVGDDGLQEAISNYPTWNSCFLHVVSDQDPVPRVLINGYKPFGIFLLCSELGCSCFEDPQTILELLMAAYSGCPENQDPNKVFESYGTFVEHLNRKVLCKDTTDHESLIDWTTQPLQAGIITKLAAIGLVRSQPMQNIDINIIVANTAKREKAMAILNKQAFDPTRGLNEIKINMAYLEQYKKVSKDERVGYYDRYKNGIDRSDINVVGYMRGLTCYWERMIDQVEKTPQTVGASLRTRSLFGGTYYRRMIEPLDIADYYKAGKQDYINQGRSKHYIILEQLLKETEKPSSGPNELKKQNVASSLTEDSCFWAHVEEALISCKLLSSRESSDEEKDSAKKKLIEFEKYVFDSMKNYAVSSEIFLPGSSFMKWWGEYREITGTSYSSSLTNLLRNDENYEAYANGSLEFP